MLDAFIIESIRERQREERERREERPFLELPLPLPNIDESKEETTEAKRVIIIDTVDEPVEDNFTIDL
jgi:hypothetical protein